MIQLKMPYYSFKKLCDFLHNTGASNYSACWEYGKTTLREFKEKEIHNQIRKRWEDESRKTKRNG